MKFPHRNLSIPDIHLGHDNTPAEEILDKLLNMLTPSFLSGCDILYFPGDLFDKAILLSGEPVPYIISCFKDLLGRCYLSGTKVRLLYGTPYHDARQGRIIQALATSHYPELDFKYVDDMIIEYIEEFDIHVMYVPDEWSTREQMYLKAKSLLVEHQLEQVDFIIGHNQFDYQYNSTLLDKISTLNSKDWNEMVRYTAYFGHIHKRSTCGKIEFAGSFDRLAHGEEFPKGFLEGNYRSETDWDISFHENKLAQIYQTIDLSHKEDWLDHYDTYIEQFLRECRTRLTPYENRTTCIRIRYHDSRFPIKDLITRLRLNHPTMIFSHILVGDTVKEDKKSLTLKMQDKYQILAITRDNIVRLVDNEIKDNPHKQAILTLLAKYVNELGGHVNVDGVSDV